jgi:hypothetical protein
MIYKSSAAYSFGKSSKKTDTSLLNKTILTNPDMGKYNKDILTKPTGGFKFSKEEKFKTFRPETPGPGKYETNKTTLGEGVPKYSINKSEKETQIGKALERSKKNKIPGPGNYTLTEENYEKTIFNKTITGHFAKEPKLKLLDNHVPGVGKYSINTSRDFGKGDKNKFTMSKTNRKNIVDSSKTSSSIKNQGDIKALDPGYYEVKSSFGKDGTKPLLRGKPKDIKKLDVPGPGKYNFDKAKMSTLKKNPSTCLGFGNRTDITAKEKKKDVPGFKYEYGTDFDVTNKSKIKANTFEKSERMPKIVNNTPGPGSYYVPCSFGVIPDYQGINRKYTKV